jgi:membrane-bound metal-dependent hydrolase YbcI (DUF457 family)
MPGWKTHIIIGAATGAAVNVALQTGRKVLKPQTPFDWGEFFICTGAASVAALAPDILEPATSPDHRGFFHSVAMAAIVAYVMTGKHTGKWPTIITLIVGAAGVGYLSHLIADSTTPKSINLV